MLGLSEVCAARHDVVQVACGCAAHTVFVVPVVIEIIRSNSINSCTTIIHIIETYCFSDNDDYDNNNKQNYYESQILMFSAIVCYNNYYL